MKLNTKRTFFIGLAFMSICAFWQIYDQIIPLILEQSFHLNATLIGLIMAADNILALIMLPLFGSLSDKLDSRYGKRTPFIFIGTMAAVIAMLLIPIADNMRSLGFFIIALALTLIAMQSYRSPAVALMPDLTPKPLRSKANAIINLMGAVGGMISLLLINLLVPDVAQPNYFPLFLSVASIMLLSVVLLIITVKENQLRKEMHEEEEEKENFGKGGRLSKPVMRSLIFILLSIAFWFMGYNAVTSAFSRYAMNVWGKSAGGSAMLMLLATAVATISYIPIGAISSKIGRKKTILFGVALLGFSFGAAGFFQEMNFFAYIIFGCVGIAWAAINVNSYPMVVEMSQEGDVGKYTGIYYTFSMSAQILTPILSGFFIEQWGYGTLFPYAFICCVLAFLCFLQVRHGDNRPEAKKGLQAFDVED